MEIRVSEKDIAIMMEDRYTRNEAIRSLKKGTVVYDSVQELADDYGVSVDDIRAGMFSDIKAVEYEGKEYGLGICN